MFARHMNVKVPMAAEVTRIEFRKVPGTDAAPHQARLDGVV